MIAEQLMEPLLEFAPLAEVPGVKLLSLQKNAGVEQIVWHRDGQMAPSNANSPEVADGAFNIDLDKASVIGRFTECENCAWTLRTRGDDRKSWIWTGGRDGALRYSVTLKPFDHHAFVVFDLALGDIRTLMHFHVAAQIDSSRAAVLGHGTQVLFKDV